MNAEHSRARVLVRTADGSRTLSWGAEHYHSIHGAVQESTHVFIKAGLEHLGKPHVDVLEVGLGTGLNLLLTWIRCLEGKLTVAYHAFEPFPLEADQLNALAHCEDLAWPGLHEPFLDVMTSAADTWHEGMGGLRFKRSPTDVRRLDADQEFDVVYFDAFAPNHQPELWTVEVFERMHRALRPGGLLVTYCAKGDVRRAMISAGFAVERLPGPPGKREMLRAVK
ncbi:MAG: tRNA (5-methylaminomethyl-2-thiouridine)(34)-methyltransferase MnmD [Flavobacteriales bacterium]|nr:tRNA (5-methylaminomethyl-2-thiouridine)(34)-methyltransferase MnmD [Flavobacteriales bacterium]